MLTVSHLNAYYGKSHVVRDLSFTARKGRALGILGRNGVGKTTTLRALMGLVARNGSVSVAGRDISALPAHQISRAGVGYIPQGRDLFYHLSVEENLRLAWHGKKFGDQELNRGIAHFPPLAEMLHREAGTLSGGEQQMVAVGRALLNRPATILMDEPTEGLSPLFVDRVSEIVHEIKTEDIAIVLVEQNLALALSVCDDVCFVEKGSIVHSCSVDEAKSPELLERYLGVGVESRPNYGRRS